MVNYSEETLLALKRRKRIYKVLMIAAAAVCVTVCAVLCFLVNRNNKIIVISVNSAVTALCGWFIIGCVFGAFLPCNANIAHQTGILAARRIALSGEITEVGATVTVSRHINAVRITVFNGAEHTFYWDSFLGECPFKSGDKVRLTVTRNFIFSYGAAADED